MVLEQGGDKIAMAACDLVSLPASISDTARNMVQPADWTDDRPRNDQRNSCAHHPGHLTDPSRYNLEGKDKQITQTYTDSLAGKIADAIVKANAALEPVEMRAGVGEESS